MEEEYKTEEDMKQDIADLEKNKGKSPEQSYRDIKKEDVKTAEQEYIEKYEKEHSDDDDSDFDDVIEVDF